MKKVQMLILGLTFSLLVLSCFAIERVGVAQMEIEGLGCGDLLGCLNKQNCGMKGTPNGCVITCQDTTVITCPKAN
ncbi:MAG TPA: hypothetical protein VN844_01155, partial [Pyrinomonadaceae bacterium]|nr:hypothetical protein [Pyrinomonadaceae bacterium]